MNNRRSFFKSLALLGAAAGCPGLFLPKLEPVRWKITRATPYDYDALQQSFKNRDFAGTWKWFGPLVIVDAPTVYAVKPEPKEFINCVLHLSDS